MEPDMPDRPLYSLRMLMRADSLWNPVSTPIAVEHVIKL